MCYRFFSISYETFAKFPHPPPIPAKNHDKSK